MELFRLSHAGKPANYAVLISKLRFLRNAVKFSLKRKNNPPSGGGLGVSHPYCARRGNSFAIGVGLLQVDAMTQPLALVLYEKLLPGSQLVNRLQDLKYRVQTVADGAKLVECAQQAKPMLVLADLEAAQDNICAAITQLKQNPATQHLPVIAFCRSDAAELQAAARTAGVTLVVSEAAILTHLPQFLDQALQID
jgi:CheY-like chemotaxis protein